MTIVPRPHLPLPELVFSSILFVQQQRQRQKQKQKQKHIEKRKSNLNNRETKDICMRNTSSEFSAFINMNK